MDLSMISNPFQIHCLAVVHIHITISIPNSYKDGFMNIKSI